MKKQGLVILLLVGMMGCSKVEEEVDSKEKEVIAYTSYGDLVAYMEESEYTTEAVNNVAYTLEVEGKVEEYRGYAKETFTKQEEEKVYPLYILDLGFYYDVSEGEISYPSPYSSHKESGAIVFMNLGNEVLLIYETVDSTKQQKAITEAAIISQGQEAEGYKEAMEASYATAVANGDARSYENFSEGYSANISQYNEQLQEMSKLSVEEIVERYDEFKDVLREIDDNLSILNPTNQ
ncbi:MAG: hypothetical protein ACK5LZ_06630 [Anaerorhabdus sp.]